MSLKESDWNVNQKLKQFNTWFDEFILVVAKPLAMLGFAMGTVDIFVRGTLATQYWFALAWAIVQALTIDGLFFAVWWRIFAARWEKGQRLANVGLTLIGGVLGLVAMATNGILGMQQLWGLADSQQAMIRLGVDPFVFSGTRAILVVAVSIMVAFVSYKSSSVSTSEHSVAQASISATTASVSVAPVAQPANQIAQTSTLHSTSDQLINSLADPKSKQAIQDLMRSDSNLNLTRLSSETGIAYSTLTKWRREL